MSQEQPNGLEELLAKADRFHEIAVDMKETAIAQAEVAAESARAAAEATGQTAAMLGEAVRLVRHQRLRDFLLVGGLVLAVLLGVLAWTQARANGEQGRRNGDAVAYARSCNEPGPRAETPDDPSTGHRCYDADQARMRAYLRTLVDQLRLSADCLVLMGQGEHPPVCNDVARRLQVIRDGGNPFEDPSLRLPVSGMSQDPPP